MQVTILDHYSNQKQILEGSEAEVRVNLYNTFPWLLQEFGYGTDTSELVNAIDETQQYSALISSVELTKSEVLIKCDQSKDYKALEEAAEFLSGQKTDEAKYREALLLFDGDEKAALLAAHSIEPSKANIEALESISVNFTKSVTDNPVVFNEVLPINESGIDFALAVKRASDAGRIKLISFKSGKHSGGTLIARDPVNYIALLLKPGSGPQNPAAGENQTQATQSEREAAFFAVSASWGLGKYVPECHLLVIDGKQYAAIKFLPPEYWENGQSFKERDPNGPRRALSLYLADIFKWATIDYVLGNPDRNSGNVMFCQGEVKLIDHGSALAGIDFKPAHDKFSFVPFYLRALAPGDFNKLTPEQKFKSLPRLSAVLEKEFQEWILRLDADLLRKLLFMHNIEPVPSLARLELIKEACRFQPADVAILSNWVL